MSPNPERVRVALYCDVGPSIGAGHVMRCYALAQRLADQGVEPVFVCDPASMPWVGRLLTGYPCVTPSVVRWEGFDAVVIDSYAATGQEVTEIFAVCGAVIVIADDATQALPADLYIEPGINQSWVPPRGFEAVRRISGGDAVLLRTELSRIPERRIAFEDRDGVKPLSVGVILGGGEIGAYLTPVLEALGATEIPMDVSVVATAGDSIRADREMHTRLLAPGIESANSVISECDVLVTSAGVVSWEAASRGASLGLVRTAANQEQNYSWFSSQRAAIPLGRLDEGMGVDLSSLMKLVSQPTVRSEIGQRAFGLSEWRGRELVSDAIVELVTAKPRIVGGQI